MQLFRISVDAIFSLAPLRSVKRLECIFEGYICWHMDATVAVTEVIEIIF